MGQCCGMCGTGREDESQSPTPNSERQSLLDNTERKPYYGEGQQNRAEADRNNPGTAVRRRVYRVDRKVSFSQPSPDSEPGRSEGPQVFQSAQERIGQRSLVDYVSPSDSEAESRAQPLLESSSSSDSETKRIGRFLVRTVSSSKLIREQEGQPSQSESESSEQPSLVEQVSSTDSEPQSRPEPLAEPVSPDYETERIGRFLVRTVSSSEHKREQEQE